MYHTKIYFRNARLELVDRDLEPIYLPPARGIPTSTDCARPDTPLEILSLEVGGTQVYEDRRLEMATVRHFILHGSTG